MLKILVKQYVGKKFSNKKVFNEEVKRLDNLMVSKTILKQLKYSKNLIFVKKPRS